MIVTVRPAGGGRRIPVGGYNAHVLWQDLGGGDTELTLGSEALDRLGELVEEHPGTRMIALMIHRHGQVTVAAEDVALGGELWR